MAKAKETAVAVKTESAVGTEVDYSQYSGSGFENQDNSDIQVPFLRILQELSPEVKSVEKGGIEGAEVGMLFNTVTQECYDAVHFVPSVTKHIYNEWIPIKQGGGFVGTYEVTDKFVIDAQAAAKANNLDFGQLPTEEGNELVETFDVYGILVAENNEPMPCIISFTSSKIKVYRKWMSGIRMFVLNTPSGKLKPDLFAHYVKITTQDEKNKAGQEYSNFKLSPCNGKLLDSLLGSNDELFIAGRDMHQMVKDGIAKADMSTSEKGGGSDDGEPKGDIPF
jgi:hypothetical protein